MLLYGKSLSLSTCPKQYLIQICSMLQCKSMSFLQLPDTDTKFVFCLLRNENFSASDRDDSR